MSASSKLGVLGGISLALDRLPFTSFATSNQHRSLNQSRVVDLHVQIVNVMPNDLEALVFLVDLNGKPDVATLPDRRQIPLQNVSCDLQQNRSSYLVSHVKISCLLGSLDPPRETTLRTKRPCISWRDKKGLRPGTLKLVSPHSHNIYTN